jgi:glycosyltransferase involved in cell wall biosynthesis
MTPAATVAIVTKNRKSELPTAIRSALAQTAAPEVLVIDDGSSDGSAEMVEREFPGVRLIRRQESKGLIVRRNEAAHAAQAPIVFSIDDDAEFLSANTVEQTLAEFNDPRIGAVAIPYIEPNKGNRLEQRAPDAHGPWITDCFKGTAHALRRDIFLELDGYRDRLVHQGEERDYCIRMLSAGLVVRSAWQAGRVWQMAKGIVSGYADVLKYPAERSPISPAIYQLHRRLKTESPLTLASVAPELPPIALQEVHA